MFFFLDGYRFRAVGQACHTLSVASKKEAGAVLESESTLTQEITAAVSPREPQSERDRRIPVLALLQCSLDVAIDCLSTALENTDVVCTQDIVVFSNQTPGSNWPDGLRFEAVPSDEIVTANGCLCCSLRSELARSLSRLFLQLLRREVKPVRLVIVVTSAADVAPLFETLRHAPFLAQRYRLVGYKDLSIPDASG